MSVFLHHLGSHGFCSNLERGWLEGQFLKKIYSIYPPRVTKSPNIQLDGTFMLNNSLEGIYNQSFFFFHLTTNISTWCLLDINRTLTGIGGSVWIREKYRLLATNTQYVFGVRKEGWLYKKKTPLLGILEDL